LKRWKSDEAQVYTEYLFQQELEQLAAKSNSYRTDTMWHILQ